MPYKTNQQRVDWAKRRRLKIIDLLGGFCQLCGSTHDLELDHKNPRSRSWSNRKAGTYGSALKYWKDYKAGLLQVLCKHHNRVKQASSWPEFQRRIAAIETDAQAVDDNTSPLPF